MLCSRFTTVKWCRVSSATHTASRALSGQNASVNNTSGEVYSNILRKSKIKGSKLAVGELKNLFRKCNEPDEFRYALKAVNIYQAKSHDFSEETASAFVTTCIRAGKLDKCAAIFSDPGMRIGAWSPPRATLRLVEALSAAGLTENVVSVLETLTAKAGRLHAPCYECMMRAVAAYEGDDRKALFERASAALESSTTLTIEEKQGIKDAQPVTFPDAPAPTAETETETVTVTEGSEEHAK